VLSIEESGEGTSIRLLLPSIPAPVRSGNHHSIEPLSSSRTVLVVDDDEGNRRLARFTLEGAGHLVLEASNGREAEAILAGAHVDLLITAVIMPEQDGLETIKAVRKSHPLLRIIAMSEATAGYQLRAAKLLGADAVIAKPLTHGVLGDAVRETLGAQKR